MNWGMIGHEWAVDLLRQHVARGDVRHAYLFSGSRGIGRRTLALRFAQALNCVQSPSAGSPCGNCQTCTRIDRMQYPDLEVIQSDQEGGVIKVDRIRELQHILALHPYEGRYRVAILLRFEEANLNTMNAMLKTLEEPAPQVVIILTTESTESLLPTIVSRCEVLRLRPLSISQVSQGLQSRWNMDAERAQILAHISCGKPGYAIRLSQDSQYSDQRQVWLGVHDQLLNANRVERFSYFDRMSKDKENLRSLVLVWLSYWRDILLKAVGTSTPVSNLDRVQSIERLAGLFGSHVAYKMVSGLERTLTLLEHNINARLAMEVLMLDLPYIEKGPVS